MLALLCPTARGTAMARRLRVLGSTSGVHGNSRPCAARHVHGDAIAERLVHLVWHGEIWCSAEVVKSGLREGDRGTAPRGTYGVHLRLSRRRGAAARDQRRAPGSGELEQREPRPVLRQGRRPDRLRQGEPGSLDAGTCSSLRWYTSTPCYFRTSCPREVAGEAHRRRPVGALSPLFWTHVNPYGRFELDMASHLDITLPVMTGPRTPADAETDMGKPAQGRTGA